jgi:hypothetical protein
MAEMSEVEITRIVRQSVHDTLTVLGVDTSDPLAMQRDFQHLREWRVAVNSFKIKGLMVVLTTLVTGCLGLIYVGFQHLPLGK